VRIERRTCEEIDLLTHREVRDDRAYVGIGLRRDVRARRLECVGPARARLAACKRVAAEEDVLPTDRALRSRALQGPVNAGGSDDIM